MIEKAKQIPSMGAADIADKLIQYARECPHNADIVECGVWMGCGSALLSIGAGSKKIYLYDHFFSNSSEVDKLKKYGIKIKPGMDTIGIVKKNLEPFTGNFIFKKKKHENFKWTGNPIGVYIDDVSKSNPNWDRICKTFLPYVVEGGKIILMDYFFFQKTGRHRHKIQYQFMNRHKDNFKKIFEKDCIAIFEVVKKYEYRSNWL